MKPGPRIALGFATLALSACASLPAPNDTPDAVQRAWPEPLQPGSGQIAYRVDPQASMLQIRVDPEGAMAALGHSHIIGGPVITGSIVLGPAGDGTDNPPGNPIGVDLSIDARELDVDRPAWRVAHGLDPDLAASAIDGTRANMLGERVLDVDRHPSIDIRSVAVSGPLWLPLVTARIRLRGQVRERVIPVSVRRSEERLEASGYLTLLQSDFGMQPFSAAGGALRVADRMEIRFRIVASAQSRVVDIMRIPIGQEEKRP
ncbi:MAG: YceI family protein [Wenzhouxiangellaceae bacterium]|nr:YceI family protein [Wenzhouxiangellaceae bacterium]